MSNPELSQPLQQPAEMPAEDMPALPVEGEELSSFARIKKTGADIIKVVLTADKSDLIRGISRGF